MLVDATNLFNKINIHGKEKLSYSNLKEYVVRICEFAQSIGCVTREFDPVAFELGFR